MKLLLFTILLLLIINPGEFFTLQVIPVQKSPAPINTSCRPYAPESANPRHQCYYRQEYNINPGLRAMGAATAYEEGFYGQGVTVAVVGTGVNKEHPELKGQVVPGYDFSSNTESGAYWDREDHETFMALIIAGIKNNYKSHGVAPGAKIMPLVHYDKTVGGDYRYTHMLRAFRYAVNKNIKIINNSYSHRSGLELEYAGVSVSLDMPTGVYEDNSFYWPTALFAWELNKLLTTKDMVLVWAAGNDSWQPQGKVFIKNSNLANLFGVDTVPRAELIKKLRVNNYPLNSADTVTLPLSKVPFINHSMPSRIALLPLYAGTPRPEMQKALRDDYSAYRGNSDFNALARRWLVVVAVDRDNKISGYSNGCGAAKYWCVAAPGDYTEIIYPQVGAGMIVNGTSQAAAYASGALALLQSAAPNTSIIDIKNILLSTATSIPGQAQPDDVYGYGVINIAAAMKELRKRQSKRN